MLSMHGTWTLKAKWLRYCFASVLLGTALIHAAISLYPMNRYYLRHIFESACGTTLSPPLVIATFQELPALFDSTIGVHDSHAVSDEAERLRHMARLNDNICSYPSSEDYLAATPNAINQMTLDIVWVKLARLGVSPGVGLWISALLLLTSAIAWIGWGSGWKGLIAQKKRNRNI
jgi:hypothetical protein